MNYIAMLYNDAAKAGDAVKADLLKRVLALEGTFAKLIERADAVYLVKNDIVVMKAASLKALVDTLEAMVAADVKAEEEKLVSEFEHDLQQLEANVGSFWTRVKAFFHF